MFAAWLPAKGGKLMANALRDHTRPLDTVSETFALADEFDLDLRFKPIHSAQSTLRPATYGTETAECYTLTLIGCGGGGAPSSRVCGLCAE